MPQLAIYVDGDTARKVDEASRRAGMSRSAWVRRAVERELEAGFPDSFFAAIGSWEDDRTPEEILASIRAGTSHQDRPALD